MVNMLGGESHLCRPLPRHVLSCLQTHAHGRKSKACLAPIVRFISPLASKHMETPHDKQTALDVVTSMMPVFNLQSHTKPQTAA